VRIAAFSLILLQQHSKKIVTFVSLMRKMMSAIGKYPSSEI